MKMNNTRTLLTERYCMLLKYESVNDNNVTPTYRAQTFSRPFHLNLIQWVISCFHYRHPVLLRKLLRKS